MGIKFTNNAVGSLASSITSTATAIYVTAGQGAYFPALAAGDYFFATLIDSSNNLEIVKVTARTTDTLTVVRGQDGTTGRAYAAGDKIELRVTAQGLTDINNNGGVQSVNGATGVITGLATSGANSNITSLSGLTTPLSTAQGGTGTTTGAQAFAAGTVLLFYQSAAPTGWTQVTTLNDYDLRLVSGAGGTTGGTTAYSTVFSNQTPTINVSGLSAGATTLSTAQMPSHNHNLNYTNSVGDTAFNYGSNFTPYSNTCSASYAQSGFFAGSNGNYVTYTGGGGSHSHSISGSASSSAITLNVRYANIIICSKN